MLFNLQLNQHVVGNFGFLEGSSNAHGDFNFLKIRLWKMKTRGHIAPPYVMAFQRPPSCKK